MEQFTLKKLVKRKLDETYTIVLNCSYLAMERILNKVNILKT